MTRNFNKFGRFGCINRDIPFIDYSKNRFNIGDKYVTDAVELIDYSNSTLDPGATIDDGVVTIVADGAIYVDAKFEVGLEANSYYLMDIEVYENETTSNAILIKGTDRFEEHLYTPSVGFVGRITPVLKTLSNITQTDLNTYLSTSWDAGTRLKYKIHSFKKVVQIPNKPYLMDLGAHPKFHAPMNTGRGVKLANNQHIPINPINPTSIKTISATCYGDEIYICGKDDSWGAYVFMNGNETKVRFGAAASFNTFRPLNKWFDVDFVIHDTTVDMHLDGKYVETATISGSFNNDYVVNQIGKLSTNYGSFSINKFALYGSKLTAEQILYQHKSPHTTLYYEDNVLKSEKLPQNVIDNVLFFSPMCEDTSKTNGHVFDYANYSPTKLVNATFDTDTENFSPFGDFSTFVVENGRLKGIPDNDTLARVGTPFAAVNQEIGKVFRYRAELECTSETLVKIYNGVTYVNTGITLPANTVVLFDYIVVSEGSYASMPIDFASATSADTIYMNNVIVDELSGALKIENWTTSSNVTELDTPLQACMWLRDLLGIPYGLADYPQFDGTGYINTKFTLDNTRDFVIYGVVKFEDTGAEQAHGTGYNGATTRVTLGCASDGRIISRLGSQSRTKGDINSGYDPFFFCIKRIHSTDTMQIKVNDVQIGSDAVGTFTESLEWVFGRQGIFETYKARGELRMWKADNIRTTDAQDTREFNKAIARRLINAN